MLDVLKELIKLTDSLLNLVTVGQATSDRSNTDNDVSDISVEQYPQTPTTWVTGTVIKSTSRNYLKVNFIDLGEILLSISQYDNAILHFADGDRASGLLCRLCIGKQWATYNANRKAKYGDISNGYIYPSTLKMPVAIEHNEPKKVDAVVPDQSTTTSILDNEPTSETSDDTVIVKTKGQQFTVVMGNYRLDCRKTSNTTLWQNIDGVLKESFNWNTVTQILESAVLEAGLSIKKAGIAYKRLVETAIFSHGLCREAANEWWQALSELAQG